MSRITQIKCGAVALFGLFALNLNLNVNAATLHETNVVSVFVQDQTERTRRNALNNAFKKVILKMSGNREFVNSRSLRGFTASNYLKAYQYDVHDNQLEYVATFDNEKMQQLLRQLNLPIWEARRPDAMLWLSVDNDISPGTSVLSEGAGLLFNRTVKQINRARGMTIALPLMDIEDRLAVTDYDIWGRFTNPVMAASERYGINHLIIARLRKTPAFNAKALEKRIDDFHSGRMEFIMARGEMSEIDAFADNTLSPISESYPTLEDSGVEIPKDAIYSPIESETEPKQIFTMQEFQQLMNSMQPVQLDYTFVLGSEQISGTLSGEDEGSLLDELLSSFTDIVATRYAITLEQQSLASKEVLRVNNIDSLVAYQGLMDFLASLTLVDDAMLVEQIGDTALIELTLLTDKQRLVNTLVLDGRLTPILNEFGDVIDDSQFDWQP